MKPLPPYLPKVLKFAEDAKRRGDEPSVIQVRHDDWCRLLNGLGQCNCNPDVVLLSQNPTPGRSA